MIDLNELEQFLVFYKNGTLSGAAAELHISQPTLTRSMQKLESDFGVSLFTRSKNKLELNDNGVLAAGQAEKLLEQARAMVELVRANDRNGHTLSIGACAPMPLLSMIRRATDLYPEIRLVSEIKSRDVLLDGLADGSYQIVILPERLEDEQMHCGTCGVEHLLFLLPASHPLAGRKGLYMEELDGENMLVFSDPALWHDLHVEKMPHSRFLTQSELFPFEDLIEASAMPSLLSDDMLQKNGIPENHVAVPILDKEASLSYYAVCRKENRKRFAGLV